MNAFTLTTEQIDRVCDHLKKKYPPQRENETYCYGVNCACAHCPYGVSNDGYGKAWDCISYYSESELSDELEAVANGNNIQ